MKLIIDANILFASLIKESSTRKIILDENFSFYVPKFLIEEFLEHIEELEEKIGINKRVLKRKIKELLRLANIIIIEKEELEDFLQKAEKVSPDPEDTMYFALALKLNCSIWSNDTKLKEQKKIKIYSTKELIKEFTIKIK